ncbi:hypothetical protein [Luteitalea sp.]
MNISELFTSVQLLMRELTFGPAPTGAFVLNPGDVGLLASLDRLSADEASMSSHGGASIAAHVAHVSYGLSLMNRWAAGEQPFDSADWNAAWHVRGVSSEEWDRLRADLRRHIDTWLVAVAAPRALTPVELNGVVGSVVHLAYHVGAIRQIHAGARGPKDGQR